MAKRLEPSLGVVGVMQERAAMGFPLPAADFQSRAVDEINQQRASVGAAVEVSRPRASPRHVGKSEGIAASGRGGFAGGNVVTHKINLSLRASGIAALADCKPYRDIAG